MIARTAPGRRWWQLAIVALSLAAVMPLQAQQPPATPAPRPQQQPQRPPQRPPAPPKPEAPKPPPPRPAPEPRIQGLPRVGETGATEEDVELLNRAARKFLESGRCTRVDYGDRSMSRPGWYVISCDGRNILFKRDDIEL